MACCHLHIANVYVSNILLSLPTKYNAKMNSNLCYECGVELSPEGLFVRQDNIEHATRGTYTLHSLYLLLWANFGAFCMALLTQPQAKVDFLFSNGLSVRHHCFSQLCAMWKHMQNNLGLSDEERSFLIMCYTNRLYEVHCNLWGYHNR